MRVDSLGLFWQDYAMANAGSRERVRPPIPDTGWTRPRDFPNLTRAKVISLDLETYDPQLLTHGPGNVRAGADGEPFDGWICGVSIATEDNTAWYFPTRHPESDNVPEDALYKWLRASLANRRQPKIGANLAYDVGWLNAYGVEVLGTLYDVQYAEPLLDENAYTYDLDALGEKYEGQGKDTDTLYQWCADAFGGKVDATQRANIWRTPAAVVGPYAEIDALLPLRIIRKQIAELKRQHLFELFHLESSLIPLLLEMRRRGVRVDLDYAQTVRTQLSDEQAYAQNQLNELAGFDVSVNSPSNLAEAFDAVGIKYPRTSTGKPSFRKAWLEALGHPLARAIVDVRKVAKLAGTFIDSYVFGQEINGRVHAQFHPLRTDHNGTVSGRFASSNPNLQNIPSRDERLAPMIRGIYLPDEGAVGWRRLDYSQIEYRFLVHFSSGRGSIEAREAYRSNPKIDFHAMVTDLIDDIAHIKLDRKLTKNVNFGLCLAAGQLVLTDAGLVPIERVSLAHKLWDGVEWVHHRGVIYKGVKHVIAYQGLRATPEHQVWTRDGRKVSFRRAASRGYSLATTGKGTHPLRARFADTRAWKLPQDAILSFRKCGVLLLQQAKRILCGQFAQRTPVCLPNESQVQQRPARSHTRPTLRRDGTTMRARYTRFESSIQRTWNSCAIFITRAIRFMGLEEMVAFNIQTPRFRSQEQRWSLFEVESSIGNTIGQSQESVAVYDILNAGPRRRFTCNGKLVSNCYGMAENTLRNYINVSQDEAERIFRAYHSAAPFVKHTYDHFMCEAHATGEVRTVLRRKSRFPWYESAVAGVNGPALPREEAKRAYGFIKPAGTHKALNRVLQGSSADQMKQAMADAYYAGVFDATGMPHVTVHDELGLSDFGTPAATEGFRELVNIMETCIPLSVPVRVDASIGKNWGECK